ncbi:MAG TPA: hypothetical protein GXX41_10830 [Thermoanaerobacterium sp.]|nr:hypothetical protein [Thermoanaerobacterium sp.]
MKINNFENHIDKTILNRGYDYYINDNIVEVYKRRDNEYIFQIQGSGDYEVIVKINNDGEIIYSECDCPYDFGPICKHQVAAYFKLFEIINNKNNIIHIKENAIDQFSIKEVLNNLSKEELIKIIMDITENDEALKNSLIVRYSKGSYEQELEKSKKLIDSIVKKYTGREGFVSYRETYSFVNDMEDILRKSRNTDDILLASDIAFLLLNESIRAFQYADDSNGDIGLLVSETIDLIGDIVTDGSYLDDDLKDEIFNKLLTQIDNEILDEWNDYKIDLLRLCIEFADVEKLRNELIAKIKSIIAMNSGDEYKRYSNEKMLQILFEIIDTYGTDEEALEFIEKNLNYTSFRELLISKFMKEKKFNKVIELALEGEKKDKKYAGLVLKWKKIRYEAYKKLSLKEEQKKLAKELLFEGNFEYYNELKELIIGDKAEFYNNLKQELRKNDGWVSRNIYLKLIVEEKDLDEIMEFVKENPSIIEGYAEMLQEKFKDEVIEVYKKHIMAVANSSSNRKEYKKVCEVIKKYKKIAGNKNMEEIVDKLIALYKNKPAFVDELNKIK